MNLLGFGRSNEQEGPSGQSLLSSTTDGMPPKTDNGSMALASAAAAVEQQEEVPVASRVNASDTTATFKAPPTTPPNKDTTRYEYPNLYVESLEMLEASVLMYAFADLRILAREGKLSPEDADCLLHLPLSMGKILEVFSRTADVLERTLGKESTQLYMESLNTLRQRTNVDAHMASIMSSKVLVIDDENHLEELVYGIAIDDADRRVTVAFRGSVTPQDFKADANELLVELPNPVTDLCKHVRTVWNSKTMLIHSGFYNYLFGQKTPPSSSMFGFRSRTTEPVEVPPAKFELIMSQLVDILLNHPGYQLYVTGHSLGGALSSLFTFEVAASNNPVIPTPITCINVASPKVGNIGFRGAFQAMEHVGRIRCLRIANHRDLVTLVPDRASFSCVYLVCGQSSIYRHVGLELVLYRNGTHDFYYPHYTNSNSVLFLEDWKRQTWNAVKLVLTLPLLFTQENYVQWHSCQEYFSRLKRNAASLKSLHLNQLYGDYQSGRRKFVKPSP